MRGGKGNNHRGEQGQGASGRGMGRGAMGGTRPGSGPGGACKCPDCGEVVEHKQGIPCFQERCPKCGQPMIRD